MILVMVSHLSSVGSETRANDSGQRNEYQIFQSLLQTSAEGSSTFELFRSFAENFTWDSCLDIPKETKRWTMPDLNPPKIIADNFLR